MENENKPTVVLLGDWYIDENWLISPQEVYYSSNPGDVHYLSLHKGPRESVTNLCAAAGILKTLKSYLPKKLENNSPEFLTFGVWNPDDDDLFQCILCGKNKDLHLSPYTLSNFPKDKQWCEQYRNKQENCDYSNTLINLAKTENVSTNRIIRCFEGHGGAEPHQRYRLDWILPLNDGNMNYDLISEKINGHNVIAILIIDHGAGVVNSNSIEQLLKATKGQTNVHWFVRTKIDNPEWLKVLKKNNITLEMNVWDYRLAAHRKGARRWWYGYHLGRAGLELLSEMTGQYSYEHGEKVDRKEAVSARSAIMLLDDNTVFGMTEFGMDEGKHKNNEKKYLGISINQPPGPKQIFNFERTTIFCVALFAQRLEAVWGGKKNNEPRGAEEVSQNFGKECLAALKCAYDWSKKASEQWSEEDLSLYNNYDSALDGMKDAYKEIKKINSDDTREPESKQYPWKSWEYESAWACWNQSSKEYGILETSKVLQLWRGEGVLKGYVCVGGPKRNAINNLVKAIGKFQNSKNPTHSFSCLIQSPPGWGKSFLAKCLASHFDMEFLEFSIAQMSDNRDLMECFATIASTQSKTQRRTLVFIDEVNAQIEGHSVMSLLLSPLWGGTFVKDRHAFGLRPGVWVFASTSSPDDLKNSDKKGSDFLSRLNGPIIELDSPKHWTNAISEIKEKLKDKSNMEWEEYKETIYKIDEYRTFVNYQKDDLKTEQVYLMVSLLNTRWGPVRKVDEKVLKLFQNLLPMNGLRSLEFFTSCFENIQRGEVRMRNVPKIEDSAELRRHVVVPRWWFQEERGKEVLVEIATRIK